MLTSEIPLSLINRHSILKKWLYELLVGKSIKITNSYDIPCDPLGIAFLNFVRYETIKYKTSLIINKIGYGINVTHNNSTNISRAIWCSKNKRPLVNKINHSRLKLTMLLDITGENINRLLTIFLNRGEQCFGHFVSYNHHIYLYELNVILRKHSVNNIINTVFKYGFCKDLFLTEVYTYSIIHNTYTIVDHNNNITCRIKEFIFNNKIVALKPNKNDINKLALGNTINNAIVTAKVLLLWKKERLTKKY